MTKKQWRGIFETTKVDVLLLSPKPVYDIGHNSLAAFTYFGLFLIMIIQSVTGLAMFYVDSNSILAPFFSKPLIIMGGFYPVRDIHHILMWAFILFAIVHIYLVFYHDYIERNGIASSIIGGWKFIDERLVKEYEDEQRTKHKIVLKKEKEKLLKKEIEIKEKSIQTLR